MPMEHPTVLVEMAHSELQVLPTVELESQLVKQEWQLLLEMPLLVGLEAMQFMRVVAPTLPPMEPELAPMEESIKSEELAPTLEARPTPIPIKELQESTEFAIMAPMHLVLTLPQ